jgi:hypothetical protein
VRINFVPAGASESKTIGSVHATLVSWTKAYEGYDLAEACDSRSQELNDAFQAVRARGADAMKEPLYKPDLTEELGDLLVIREAQIVEEHRGMGLSLLAVARLIESYSGVALVVLRPAPFHADGPRDDVAIRRSKAKLAKHWARLGFKRIAGRSGFYSLDTSRVSPTFAQLLAELGEP